jgi:hypothetical protein
VNINWTEPKLQADPLNKHHHTASADIESILWYDRDKDLGPTSIHDMNLGNVQISCLLEYVQKVMQGTCCQ